MPEALIDVKNLVVSFTTEFGTVNAVDGISFSIDKRQTVGLVGESGCGKSVTSLSLLQLIESPPGQVKADSIMFGGRDLGSMSDEDIRKIRGNEISMIFQEPMTSLNPVFTIGDQIAEVFRIHKNMSKTEARKQSIEMLRKVNIPAPHMRIDEYPHQLSGGMRQRVMIAMALACQPRLLIADEPTTALDVTIQAQILRLMADLKENLDMAMLLITHDLGVVAEVCDYVMVMYGGRIIEQGKVEDIFLHPKHPYTKGLLNSIPRLGSKVDVLPTIEGAVPSLHELPSGCRFRNRCKEAKEICKQQQPKLKQFEKGHLAACWLYNKSEQNP